MVMMDVFVTGDVHVKFLYDSTKLWYGTATSKVFSQFYAQIEREIPPVSTCIPKPFPPAPYFKLNRECRDIGFKARVRLRLPPAPSFPSFNATGYPPKSTISSARCCARRVLCPTHEHSVLLLIR